MQKVKVHATLTISTKGRVISVLSHIITNTTLVRVRLSREFHNAEFLDMFNTRRSPPTWRHDIRYNKSLSCINCLRVCICVRVRYVCASVYGIYIYYTRIYRMNHLKLSPQFTLLLSAKKI